MPDALNTTSELARHPAQMAILPIGATEQHSRHLPLATDTLLVQAVAERVAEKLKAYCLPALPFSISHMHRGSRGSVWLRNQTLTTVIRDIATSLRHEGFKQLVILNGHGGNFVLVPIVQDLNLDFPDLLSMTLDIGAPIPSSGIFKNLSSLLHADEYETSCMMYLHPETVRTKKIQDQPVELEGQMLRYLPFSKLSSKTHSGKPSRATAKQGKRAVECSVNYCVQQIQSMLKKVSSLRKKS